MNAPKLSALAPWPRRIMIAFGLWFLLAEAGTQAWFDWHELHAPPVTRWDVQWPRQLPGYEAVEIPEAARTSFMYATDESSAAKWQTPDSPSLWLGYFLRWKPGRETSILASTHHPDVCLPASGKPLVTDYGTTVFHAVGLDFPVEVYQFDDAGQPLFVFYCVWSDGHAGDYSVATGETREDKAKEKGLSATLRHWLLPYTPSSQLHYRLRAIANGQRNKGQQLLELGLWGSTRVDEAKQAFARELTQLVVRSP